MTRLICIKNPAIIVSAPDELVSEVGGNCWQIGGPQPLTYPKHLWEKESQPSLPSNLDEAADAYSENILANGEDMFDAIADGFRAGAEWMAGQGVTEEAVIGMATEEIAIYVSKQTLDELDLCPGDKVVVQIRKK